MTAMADNHRERHGSPRSNRTLHKPNVQSRAPTDWPAPTCAFPSNVVRRRGRCPCGAGTKRRCAGRPARAFWKGYLKLSLVSGPIALYTGTSSTERVSFRRINKETGNRLRQQLVDNACPVAMPVLAKL
jgi:hypothetical protein